MTTDWPYSKQALLVRGKTLVECFCTFNGLPTPTVTVHTGRWAFDACAYYRPREGIVINVDRCAEVGSVGRQWSWPGYTVDRTPYGVLCHELGHHVDVLRSDHHGRYSGDYSLGMRTYTGEEPITSYCPDDGEWFAEMFRLFLTNPDLLKMIRPKTHAVLIADGFRPVLYDRWENVLKDAPERTIAAAHRKVWNERDKTAPRAT